jgi:hypothetical protein
MESLLACIIEWVLRDSYLFGAAGGWSLLNTSRFFAMYDSQLGGTSSSAFR